MARINLLPWRESRRKKQQRDFGIATLVAVVFTAVACGAVYFYIDLQITQQNQRNEILKKEIALMDEKIKEIRDLEKTKARLIARMNVIQELQVSRPQVVHLFDQVVESIPDGAFLTRLAQQGNRITLAGRAQSNARVSAYMRNIEASEWLAQPTLLVISNEDPDGNGLSEFTLNALQSTPAKDAKKEGAQ